VTHDDFAQMLAPRDVAGFVAEQWERAPLFIPGTREKIERWHCDLEGFFASLSAPSLRGHVKAQFTDAEGAHREEQIDGAQARAQFETGLTICVTKLDAGEERLARLAASARQSLGHAGTVVINCYVSPPGKGFGLHFDSQSVFIIQLDGKKRWRYSRQPAMPSPPGNMNAHAADLARFQREFPWAQIEIPAEDSLAEQLLSPGDVLYLPAGSWHRARAEGHSIALTLTVAPLSGAQLLLDTLGRMLAEDPEWRRYVPLAPTLPTTGVPAQVQSFLSSKLAELRARLGDLSENALAIRWRTDLAGSREDAPPAPTRVELSPSDVLRVAKPAGLIDHPQHQTVALFAGRATLELPDDNRTFLVHLVERDQFVAQDALAFCEADEELDWEDVREALEVLVELGALTVAR
jgi:ribosomal protein L16 Arg81 hydroxylase